MGHAPETERFPTLPEFGRRVRPLRVMGWTPPDGLLRRPTTTAQINPGLSFWLNEKWESRQRNNLNRRPFCGYRWIA